MALFAVAAALAVARALSPLAQPAPHQHMDMPASAWQWMVDGQAFAQFIYEPPDFVHRTGGFSTHQVNSVNWGMLMGQRAVGSGRVEVEAMLSAEPWTVPGCGALNFFQNGETCEGDTIHDRQHPHDLFMALTARYTRPWRGGWRWDLYGGPAGSPALGPTAFPHRASAADNPVAPIGHHWLDSTHISFGVVTAGLLSERVGLEVSAFNGREPDERRTDLDLGPLDSIAGRLSWFASPRLSLQVSAGHLTEAEHQFEPSPRTPIDRLTASASYERPLSAHGWWASTIAYGMNGGHVVASDGADTFRLSNAVLAETAITLRGVDTIFGRLEVVGKPGHDLHVDIAPADILPIAKLQAGYVRHFPVGPALGGVGVSGSVSEVPAALRARYDGRRVYGLSVYFVVRTARHTM
jgi:hypothetical protein